MMTARQIRWSNRVAAVFFASERTLSWLARKADMAAWRWSFCEYCGENRYLGRTCREVLGYTPGWDDKGRKLKV